MAFIGTLLLALLSQIHFLFGCKLYGTAQFFPAYAFHGMQSISDI